MRKPPKHICELATVLDMTPKEAAEHLSNARRFFGKHGIYVGYSRASRLWIFTRLDSSDCQAGTVRMPTIRCGIGAFVDRLDAPSETIKELQ